MDAHFVGRYIHKPMGGSVEWIVSMPCDCQHRYDRLSVPIPWRVYPSLGREVGIGGEG